MLIEEAVRFLSQVPPFQFLEEPLLRELVRAAGEERASRLAKVKVPPVLGQVKGAASAAVRP